MFNKYLACLQPFLTINNQNVFIENARPPDSSLEESYATNFLQTMISRFEHNFYLYSGDLQFETNKDLICGLSPLIEENVNHDRNYDSFYFSDQNPDAFKMLCQILEGKTVLSPLNEKNNLRNLLDELGSDYLLDSNLHDVSAKYRHRLFFNIDFFFDWSKKIAIKTPQKIYFPDQFIIFASDVLFEKYKNQEIELVDQGCETTKYYFYDPHDDIDYDHIFSFFGLSQSYSYQLHLDSLLKISTDFKIQFAIPLIEKILNNQRIIIERFSQYDTSHIEKLNKCLYESKQDEIESVAEYLKSSIWMSDSGHMKELVNSLIFCVRYRYDRILPLVDLCEKLGEPFLTVLNLHLSKATTKETIFNNALTNYSLNYYNITPSLQSFYNKLSSKQLINNQNCLSIEDKCPLKICANDPRKKQRADEFIENNCDQQIFDYFENDDVDALKNHFYRDSILPIKLTIQSESKKISRNFISSSLECGAINCFKLLDSLKIYDLNPKDISDCISSGNEELIRYVIKSISPEYQTIYNIKINYSKQLSSLKQGIPHQIDDSLLHGNILSHNNRIVAELLCDKKDSNALYVKCNMKPLVAISSILGNNISILKESINLLCDCDLNVIICDVIRNGFTEMFFLLISIFQNIFSKNEMQNLISFAKNSRHNLISAAYSGNIQLLRYLYYNSKPINWALDKLFDIQDKQTKLKYFDFDKIFQVAIDTCDLDIMTFLLLECEYIPPSNLVYEAIPATFSPNNLAIIEFFYNHNLIELQWLPFLIEIFAIGNTDSSFNILQQVCARIMKEFNIKTSKDELHNETDQIIDEDKQENEHQFDFSGIFERAFLMALVSGRERNVEFLSQFDMPNLSQMNNNYYIQYIPQTCTLHSIQLYITKLKQNANFDKCLELLILNSCSLDDGHEIFEYLLQNHFELLKTHKLFPYLYAAGYTRAQFEGLLSQENIEKVDYHNIEFPLREIDLLIQLCIQINNPNNLEFLNFLLSKSGDPASAMRQAIKDKNYGAFKVICESSICNVNNNFESSKLFLDCLCSEQKNNKTISYRDPTFESIPKEPTKPLCRTTAPEHQSELSEFYGIKCIHKKVEPTNPNLDAILNYFRPYVKNIIDNSMLIDAAKNNNLKLVEYLLSFNKLNINSVSSTTLTPLMYATINGNRKMFDLLYYSPSINVNKLTDLKRSVLSYAVISLPEVVPLILNNDNSKKIDENFSSKEWRFDPQRIDLCTVLASCFYSNNLELFDKILEFDFNLHQRVTIEVKKVRKADEPVIMNDDMFAVPETDFKFFSIFELIILYGQNFSIPFLKHLVNHKNFASRSTNSVIIDNEEWPLFDANDGLFDNVIGCAINSPVNFKLFEILLRISGNDVNMIFEKTPLIVYAAKNNNIGLIDLILNSPKFDPNYLHQGHAAFCMALYFDCIEVAVRIYNKIKIDINEYAPDGIKYLGGDKHHYRPYHKYRNLSEIPLLNPKFSKVTVFKNRGIDGVDYNSIEEVKSFLSQTSTDDKSADIAGLTPFSIVILGQAKNCCRYLLSLSGLLINKINKNGKHPLLLMFSCVTYDSYSFFNDIMALPELDVSVTDENGNTLIMSLLDTNFRHAISFFEPICRLRKDFDFLHHNKDGKTIRTFFEIHKVDTTTLGPDPTNQEMQGFLSNIFHIL